MKGVGWLGSHVPPLVFLPPAPALLFPSSLSSPPPSPLSLSARLCTAGTLAAAVASGRARVSTPPRALTRLWGSGTTRRQPGRGGVGAIRLPPRPRPTSTPAEKSRPGSTSSCCPLQQPRLLGRLSRSRSLCFPGGAPARAVDPVAAAISRPAGRHLPPRRRQGRRWDPTPAASGALPKTPPLPARAPTITWTLTLAIAPPSAAVPPPSRPSRARPTSSLPPTVTTAASLAAAPAAAAATALETFAAAVLRPCLLGLRTKRRQRAVVVIAGGACGDGRLGGCGSDGGGGGGGGG